MNDTWFDYNGHTRHYNYRVCFNCKETIKTKHKIADDTPCSKCSGKLRRKEEKTYSRTCPKCGDIKHGMRIRPKQGQRCPRCCDRYSAEKITFTCDKEGCTNQRTILKSVYKSSKTHFCSKACYYTTVDGVRTHKKPSKKRQEEFVEKFNNMFNKDRDES